MFYAHATIRKALAEAVRWQLVPRNVAELASPPKQTTTRQMVTLPDEELRRFLAYVAGDRLFAAFRLAAYTGLHRASSWAFGGETST